MKSKHFIVAFLALSVVSLTAAKETSEDGRKSIESVMPEILNDVTSFSSSPEQFKGFIEKVGETGGWAPRYPAWSFKIDNLLLHPGEPIFGRLIVKNEDPKSKFVFIPPFHGALVDTVEVWYRRKESDKQPERVSLFLKHLIGGGDNLLRSGVPLVLAPGEKYEVSLSINTYSADNTDRGAHEFSGAAVMTEPGEYEFYVRYLNWDSTEGAPVTDDSNNDALYRQAQIGKIYGWSLPQEKFAVRKEATSGITPISLSWRKPIVLGPFHIKVEPWPTERENEMAKKIAAMWKRTLDIDHCRILFPPYDPQLVKEALEVFPPSKEKPCSIGAMLKIYDWIVRYPDPNNLRRVRIESWTPPPAPRPGPEGTPPDDVPDSAPRAVFTEEVLTEGERAGRLKEMLKELRAMKADEKPGVLRDLICYWEVRTLIDRGEREEALKTANQYSTPDIMALVGRRIGLELDPKWREIGPVRHLPAAEGATPDASNATPSATGTGTSSEGGAEASVAEAAPFPWVIVIVVAIAALSLGAIFTFILTRAKKTAK